MSEYTFPEDLLYTKEHEWIKKTGSNYQVGITDYAVKMLNDIVYVNLPEIGKSLRANEVFGQVESVKTVSDLYMPVSGKVTKTNSKLTQTPEILASSPYEQGWMLEIDSQTYPRESESLLNAKAYSSFISELKPSE